MHEQSFTLYAHWGPEDQRWMIVDESDFHPLVSAGSVDELLEQLRGAEALSPPPSG